MEGLPEWIADLEPEEQELLIRWLSPDEAESAEHDWGSWAHAGQLPPGDDWRTWVIMAGRGFGKTLAGSQWITAAVSGGEPLRIALVGGTIDEARRVMVEGKSGLLAVADAWVADWHPSLRQLKFRTGAEATLFSGASPEALRGPEHHLAWCDELAKWEKAGETWDMLQLGLRLGDRPRALVTTTPRPGPVLQRIMEGPGCVVTGGPTRANPHLPASWKQAVEDMYAGTRLGRQELDGVLLSDSPGALWTVELIERCRLAAEHAGTRNGMSPVLHFTRIVIGVDPPSGDGTCGIIACARDGHGIAHVLADHSVTALSPEGWARAVADAAEIHSSPVGGGAGAVAGGGVLVVAEKNQGGKMVESVLRIADPRLKLKLVTATVGKSVRAEPVALLFEAGKARLHGCFPELEAEMLGMIAGGSYEGPGVSPDRADALVWALTELMLGKERGLPSIKQL